MEEMTIWEQYTITLNRDPRKGFGIAISGGRDRPNSSDGDTSIIISDVVPGGPAVGRLQTRDKIAMVNGLSMENVSSSFAISTLKTCGKLANITVKRPRKIHLPVTKSSQPKSQPPLTPTKHATDGRNDDSDEDYGYQGGESAPSGQHPRKSRQRTEAEHNRGYDGDSSSERSSGHYREDENDSTRRQPLRSRRRSQEGGYRRRSQDSGSDKPPLANGHHYKGSNSGLVLMSGFKRLPRQDVPMKPVRSVLVKRKESEEYGLKLGSQIFIKHIAETGLAAKNNSLQEGDLILKINGVISQNMSLEETRQLIEQSEGKLTLLVLRDNSQFLVNIPQVRDSDTESSHLDDISDLGSDISPPPPVGSTPHSPQSPTRDSLRSNRDYSRQETATEELTSPPVLSKCLELSFSCKVDDNERCLLRGKNLGSLANTDVLVLIIIITIMVDCTVSQMFRLDFAFLSTHRVFPKDLGAEQFASLESVLKTTSKTSNALGARAEFWKLRGLRGAKRMLRKSREDLSNLTKQGHYPPYEKVVLKEATFKRPVVILGPIADIAMQKLSTEMPDQFQTAESVIREGGTSKVIKLDTVWQIAKQDKHALLDITPAAVERLNYVQYFPIVVFCEPDSRQGIKAMRQWLVPDSKKSSRRLYVQASKMQKYCSHLFTATISLAGGSNNWYQTLKEIIQIEQARPVWMTEEQVDASAEESLDILNQTSAISMGDLTCDSRANSDYEETDAEGEPYTDQELDEPYQEAALSRSSEPAEQNLDQDLNERVAAALAYPIDVHDSDHQPQGQWHSSYDIREYEHEALRQKFTHAQTYDSESDQDYGYDWGPATDL
ncbi:tight junction protein ZO-3 [Notechis scutatus]|uniref:Tight junction protein ZO-3 n=1 Tax=Notechis scutatus TaxID=8663 RepID=A0A6J1VKR3_9SAUR|nr:tight junction protein ZO-3 [Notechis scutatus]